MSKLQYFVENLRQNVSRKTKTIFAIFDASVLSDEKKMLSVDVVVVGGKGKNKIFVAASKFHLFRFRLRFGGSDTKLQTARASQNRQFKNTCRLGDFTEDFIDLR